MGKNLLAEQLDDMMGRQVIHDSYDNEKVLQDDGSYILVIQMSLPTPNGGSSKD